MLVWPDFQKVYLLRFQKIYGPLTEEKKEQVAKLIQCGKFQNRFQRHICPDCGTMLVVPFTCKSRLCLSCARKRLFGWSLNLSHIMNTTLQHSHVTFTIPGQISRILFERRYKPEQMISIAASIYKSFLLSTINLKGKEYQPGILATLHKSGNGLNYNPLCGAPHNGFYVKFPIMLRDDIFTLFLVHKRSGTSHNLLVLFFENESSHSRIFGCFQIFFCSISTGG